MKKTAGYDQRGVRDGTGPYRFSAMRSVSPIGRRKLKGLPCPVEEETDKKSKGKKNDDDKDKKTENKEASATPLMICKRAAIQRFKQYGVNEKAAGNLFDVIIKNAQLGLYQVDNSDTNNPVYVPNNPELAASLGYTTNPVPVKTTSPRVLVPAAATGSVKRKLIPVNANLGAGLNR